MSKKTEENKPPMLQIREQLNTAKKDYNMLGKDIKEYVSPNKQRIIDAYKKDPATCEKFFKTELWEEIQKIQIENEQADIEQLINTLDTDKSNKLRGQITGSRMVIKFFKVISDKIC